jgi:TBC1 domain family member 2
MLSSEVGGWTNGNEDEEEEDDEEEIIYDDDEDEFGLPSITSMRKRGKCNEPSQMKSSDPGGGSAEVPSGLVFGLGSRQRANSSDIAEERGLPMYPNARKGEGKMLRPQYKEILRGIVFLSMDCPPC